MTLPTIQERGGAFSGLLQGLGMGVQQSLPTISELILNKQKQQQISEAFPNIFTKKTNQSSENNNSEGILNGNIPDNLAMGSSNTPQYTMEDAAKASLMGQHDLAQTILKGVETQNRIGEQEREFHFKRAGKILEDVGASINSMPEKKLALQALRNAVEKDETGFFSPSNISGILSDITGITLPKDATGAQIEAARKNLLINSLNKVGARGLNQFLEKQIGGAFPQIGQSREANEQALIEAELANDLEEKYLDTVQELYTSQMKTRGYPSADIDIQAQQMIRPYVKEKLKEYEETSKAIGKKEKGEKEKVNFSSLEEMNSSLSLKKGDKARNKKTGEEFVWNGSRWQSIKK